MLEPLVVSPGDHRPLVKEQVVVWAVTFVRAATFGEDVTTRRAIYARMVAA